MTTKDIRTSHAHTVVCDVCGRTLLRGERAEVYIAGSDRRSVCELCTPRALHEGWVREGTLPEYDRSAAGASRRRGLLARLRQRRRAGARAPAARPTLDDELSGRAWDQAEPDRGSGQAAAAVNAESKWDQVAAGVDPDRGWGEPNAGVDPDRGWGDPAAGVDPDRADPRIDRAEAEPVAGWQDGDAPLAAELSGSGDGRGEAWLPEEPDPLREELGPTDVPTSTSRVRRPRSTREPAADELRPLRPSRRGRRRSGSSSAKERHAQPREPRHVRAVPSSHEQKIAAAVKLFNQSEHRRTVAGVAKSLGGPCVSVLPAAEPPSLVQIVISWELCWYRYAVDLSEEPPSVRVDGQGSELSELTAAEQTATAQADDTGQLLIG